MGVGAQIRAARRRAGLTQEELAARSGVRQPNIAAYEAGRRRPSESMLTRLLAAARPRPSQLLAERRDEVIAAATRNRATNIRVFGSVARGKDTPDSDVDVLVTFQPGASLLDQAGLVEDLQNLLGVRVDVLSDRALKERDSPLLAEAVPL